ncbi:MAG: hypothetical protein AAF587_07190 [Bacteroidota bacterium]
MRSTFTFFTLAILIGLSACQQSLAPEHAEYIGRWHSDTYFMEINQNGSGTFDSNKVFGVNHVEGIVRIREDRIIFRNDEKRRSLSLDQTPQLVEDPISGLEQMVMTIEGEEVIRE